jgi:hypothetical protein
VSTKVRHQQNIGVDKILALTKVRHRQNIGVDKMLASTKCCRRQNICVNKILAHAQIMYKSSGASSYCFGLAKSAWLIPDLADVLLLEDVVLSSCSHQVRLPLAASHLWADSLPHRTCSFLPARHAEISQILTSIKYQRPPRFHYYYLKCLLGLKDILQYFLWPHTGGALI